MKVISEIATLHRPQMITETTVKQRLLTFIKYKGIPTRRFCNLILVSQSYVSNINKSIQPDKINRISEQFPDLNTGWLLTGNGEMLNEDLEKAHADDTPCLECGIKDSEIKELKDKIIALQDHLLNNKESRKVKNSGK